MVAAALAFSACSGNGGSSPSAEPATAPPATSDAVASPSCPELTGLLKTWQDAGTIRVGTTIAPPVSYTEGDAFKGAMAEVFLRFLEDQCITAKVEVIPTQFSSLIPSVQADRLDIVVDAIYIKPDREEVVDFTDPVMWDPEALLVGAGNPNNLHQLTDLCGYTVGVNEGSTYVEYLAEATKSCPADNQIQVKQYPDFKDEWLDVSTGRLDAGVADSIEAAYALEKNPGTTYELVADYLPFDKPATKSGMFIKQDAGADFLAAFNPFLKRLQGDGSIDEIFTEYGLVPLEVYTTPN
jgi:polar amino acid transport system substrate-binding protein